MDGWRRLAVNKQTRHAGIIRPLYVFGGLITGLLAKLVFFP